MSAANLGSRAVRSGIGNGGIRKLTENLLGKITKPGGGLAKFLGIGLLRFGGFLVSEIISFLVVGITISFTSLWGFIVNELSFIWSFNWNKPDEELQKETKSELKSLAGQVGFLLGDALGYAVCGVLPGAKLHTFNEGLALHVFKELGDYALYDIAGNIAAVIQQGFITAGHIAFTYIYTNVRSLLRPSNEEFKKELIKKGITNEEQLKKAVESRNKPWTFAKAYEEKVGQIHNETVRDMVKQGVEGFTQSCIQAGYVIAGSFDSYLAQAKEANNGVLGLEEGVEIILGKKQTNHVSGH